MIDSVRKPERLSTFFEKRGSCETSGMTSGSPLAATQPATPSPTLSVIPLSPSLPGPTAMAKASSRPSSSTRRSDQFSGRRCSLIFVMISRSTSSRSRVEVRALPISLTEASSARRGGEGGTDMAGSYIMETQGAVKTGRRA